MGYGASGAYCYPKTILVRNIVLIATDRARLRHRTKYA